jgi:hypothetical protein
VHNSAAVFDREQKDREWNGREGKGREGKGRAGLALTAGKRPNSGEGEGTEGATNAKAHSIREFLPVVLSCPVLSCPVVSGLSGIERFVQASRRWLPLRCAASVRSSSQWSPPSTPHRQRKARCHVTHSADVCPTDPPSLPSHDPSVCGFCPPLLTKLLTDGKARRPKSQKTKGRGCFLAEGLEKAERTRKPRESKDTQRRIMQAYYGRLDSTNAKDRNEKVKFLVRQNVIIKGP